MEERTAGFSHYAAWDAVPDLHDLVHVLHADFEAPRKATGA
jgi:hypothetical protein